MNLPPLLGPYGGLAPAGKQRFKDSEANALWFHGFNPEMFDLAVAAGKKACVEFKTFRTDFSEHPELIPIGTDGKPIRCGKLVQGVCLSKKWYLEERTEELKTALGTFSPAGIWLDYLTYGGWFEMPDPDLQDNCFCGDCIQDFCRATGIDADTPGAILASHKAAWIHYKTDRMAAMAGIFSNIIKTHDPQCLVGAYMCPWTPADFDGALMGIFGQDYTKFAPHIDVFTPLIYCEKSGRPKSWASTWLKESKAYVPGAKKVQPILDFLDFPESLTALSNSGRDCWGFQMFNGKFIFESDEYTDIFNRAAGSVGSACLL